MTKQTKQLVFFLAVLVLGYLFGAFVAWNINPGAWEVELRWIAASASLFVGGMVWAAVGDLS